MIYIVTLEKEDSLGLERTARSLQELEIDWEWIIISQSGEFSPVVQSLDPLIIQDSGLGVYAAMNIAIQNIHDRESYVYFLNSGDEIISESFVKAYQGLDPNFDYFICKVVVRELNGNLSRIATNNFCSLDSMLNGGRGFLQQGVIHRKTFFDNYGLFDSDYRVAGDLALYARSASRVKIQMLDLKIANFYLGGLSSTHRVTTAVELFKCRQNVTGVPKSGLRSAFSYYYLFHTLLKAFIIWLLPNCLSTLFKIGRNGSIFGRKSID